MRCRRVIQSNIEESAMRGARDLAVFLSSEDAGTWERRYSPYSRSCRCRLAEDDVALAATFKFSMLDLVLSSGERARERSLQKRLARSSLDALTGRERDFVSRRILGEQAPGMPLRCCRDPTRSPDNLRNYLIRAVRPLRLLSCRSNGDERPATPITRYRTWRKNLTQVGFSSSERARVVMEKRSSPSTSRRDARCGLLALASSAVTHFAPNLRASRERCVKGLHSVIHSSTEYSTRLGPEHAAILVLDKDDANRHLELEAGDDESALPCWWV